MGHKKKDWFEGLDIGTGSVGFAATDTEYNILTKNGKLQCGTRIFDTADTAAVRRGFRSARRRSDRRKMRRGWLQSLFAKEIDKIDPAFFTRINESNLHVEDKTTGSKLSLFDDNGYTDKEHYNRFPTSYHLRNHLLKNDETDPRLLYLALDNLFDNRGHFIFEEFNIERDEKGYSVLIDSINEQLREQTDSEDTFNASNTSGILSIVQNKSITNAKQWDEISELLRVEKRKTLKAVFTAMRGNKISLKGIWPDLDDAETELDEELKNFKFSAEEYDDCLSSAEQILDETKVEFLELLKAFYDKVQLDRIMMDHATLAEAMVAGYNEHKEDLKLLKSFIKTYLPNEYDKMFRVNTDYTNDKFEHASYSNYVGSNISNSKKSISHSNKCVTKGKEPVTASHNDFLKYTVSVLDKADADAKETEEYKVLITKIENKTLCKKQRTHDNAYIPNQLAVAELKAILERQTANFPFLQETDKYGTVAEKFVMILNYRIPYYVGPLPGKGSKSEFAWTVRNRGMENGEVFPWNLEEIVDLAETGKRFIRRMTAKCTYLGQEDVLPKESLLYQKYMVLNELNNLKINGNRITQEVKQALLDSPCQTETSLTISNIKSFLINMGLMSKTDIIGKGEKETKSFEGSLSSYIKLRKILGEDMDEDLCETVIMLNTVFGHEKSPVKTELTELYGDRLTEDQIDKLSKLSFKGWGRMSKKFLSGITTTDKRTGETALTIIKLLEETSMNMMELINSDSYEPKFNAITDAENKSLDDFMFGYELIEDLYCSPSVKRSIWQALRITKELTKINGCPPKKVFIEVNREKGKKGKGKLTKSRYDQVEELLKAAAKDGLEMSDLMDKLSKTENKQSLKSDKLYLYFTQIGKDMYSGESIRLDDLSNDALYDIDHIYPESKIKDDSLTNRILVRRADNAYKSDRYPIDKPVQEKMSAFWRMLKDKGLISEEKYSRLICTQPLTREIIGGFVNRQLDMTNQAVKETAKVLGLLFGNETKIVYSKASNVSEFRNKFDMVKCREVNNLHHAHDAYLNIIVGNMWDSVYSDFWNNNDTFNENRALNKLFTVNRAGVWDIAYIGKIKDYLYADGKYLDKYSVTVRPYEKKGAFYDQTVHPKGKAQYERRDGLDVNKYGGYKQGTNAYNCLIEYDKQLTKGECKKGVEPKRVKGIFPVPVRHAARYKGDKLFVKIAEENDIADSNPKMIIPMIPMFSVLEIDGLRYHMRSGDLQLSSTVEWYPSKEITQIVHDIVKYQTQIATKQIELNKNTSGDIILANRSKNKESKGPIAITRENNLKLFDTILDQVCKPFYAEYVFAGKVKRGEISKEKFELMKTHDQVEQLINLLNMITMNGAYTNAEAIGGGKYERCKCTVNNTKDISAKNIYLITQSVTGLFENRVTLNAVN